MKARLSLSAFILAAIAVVNIFFIKLDLFNLSGIGIPLILIMYISWQFPKHLNGMEWLALAIYCVLPMTIWLFFLYINRSHGLALVSLNPLFSILGFVLFYKKPLNKTPVDETYANIPRHIRWKMISESEMFTED